MSRIAKMTPRVEKALRRQRKKFIKKFGREPGPDDPVFFDPDADEPVGFPPEKMKAQFIEGMKKAGIRAEIIYAYSKTGALLSERNLDNYPRDLVAECNATVDEFREIEKQAKKSPQ